MIFTGIVERSQSKIPALLPYSSTTPNEGSALDTYGTVGGSAFSQRCYHVCKAGEYIARRHQRVLSGVPNRVHKRRVVDSVLDRSLADLWNDGAVQQGQQLRRLQQRGSILPNVKR